MTDKRINILEAIAKDMENDAKEFDSRPFEGKMSTVKRHCNTCPATSRMPFADGWNTGPSNNKRGWDFECGTCADKRNAKQRKLKCLN